MPALTDTHQALAIDSRFHGLPEVVHGGYVAGLTAGALPRAATEVNLKRPVRTGRQLTLERVGGDRAELRDGEVLLAEAAPAELSLDVPQPVTPAQAEAASERFLGHRGHLFPGCFVCGTGRGAGDGLRIFPGPVADRRLVAASWVPGPDLADADGRVRDEVVWATLDCPQLWSLVMHLPAATPDLAVTGALATRLGAPVVAGEPYVVMGWPIGRKGRSWLAGAALIGPDGELCAAGRQTAATTNWGIPLGRAHWPRRG